MTVRALIIAFVYLPELESGTLLLKMPQTLDMGFGGSQLEMTWKRVACGLALIVLECDIIYAVH